MMHWQNLKYLVRHKWYVLLAGIKYRVWWHQLVLHDWTKLLPVEWWGYGRFFFGQSNDRNRTIDSIKAKRSHEVVAGFERAWNHHQKMNPHHWQYWVAIKGPDRFEALEMPERFVREMIADWTGAGRAIKGYDDTRGWYLQNRHNMILHDVTRKLVVELLGFQDQT